MNGLYNKAVCLGQAKNVHDGRANDVAVLADAIFRRLPDGKID